MSEMHYYANYTDTRDIDCFFRVGDVAYHFASNGQPIPQFITRKTNIAVQDAVYEALENAKGDVVVNDVVVRELILREITGAEGAGLEQRVSVEMIANYVESFKAMAKLGFVSMDLDEEGVYHVIVKPAGQQVPENIMRMLPEAGAEIREKVKEDER
jgi:hypothetical protein